MYPLERVHVVTGFIIYTYVCNKNSLFVNPPKYTLLPPPPPPSPTPRQKKKLHEPLFANATWSTAFSQKHLKTIPVQNLGGKQSVLREIGK